MSEGTKIPQNRGQWTPQVEETMRANDVHPANVTALRLIPYLAYLVMERDPIDPRKVSQARIRHLSAP